MFLDKSTYYTNVHYNLSHFSEAPKPIRPASVSSKKSRRLTSLDDDHASAQFVEDVYLELLRIYSRKKYRALARRLGLSPQDCAEYGIRRVVTHTEEYLDRSPLHVANARAENAFWDLCRRERVDRGEGARGTREVVGDKPINPDSPQRGSIIEGIPSWETPQEDFIDREYYRGVLLKLKALTDDQVAWVGLWLTSVEGLTHGEAALRLGVARRTLWRRVDAVKKIARENQSSLGWVGF